MPRYTLRDVPTLVAARKAFDAGNVSAVSYYQPDIYGRQRGLGDEVRGQNRYVWPKAGALYLVYSYSTPIAWIDEFGIARRSPQNFSVTTSRHQGMLWGFEDDEPLRGTKRDRQWATKLFERGVAAYHQDREALRRERQRDAAKRRYWTPERIAAKEARERAREVAELYGIPVTEARRALTDTQEDLTVEDAVASITRDVYASRDESRLRLTHA